MRILIILVTFVGLADLHAQRSASIATCTVVSYNIRYDNPRDSLDRWKFRREALAHEVMRHRPQVIGLQEVQAHQLAYFDAQWPGYARCGVGREDGLAKGEFSPIYFDTAAYRLIDGRTIWLSATPNVPSKGWDAACERIATYVVLWDERTNDSLWIVNTHWDHVGTEARLNSAHMVQELVAAPIARGRHVLVLGDFNATSDQPSIVQLARTLKDAAPIPLRVRGTFNGFDLQRTTFDRIDYVWHSPRNWELLRYDVPQPKVNGRHVSDHFPVVVGLRAL